MEIRYISCTLGTKPKINTPSTSHQIPKLITSSVKSREKNQRENWSEHNRKTSYPHQSPWSKQIWEGQGSPLEAAVRAGRWGKCCEQQSISTSSHMDARLQPEASPAIVTVQLHCQSDTIQGLPVWLSGLAWSLQFQPDFLTTWQSPAAITLFPCSLFIPSFVSLNPQAEKKEKKQTKGKKPWLIKTRQWLHFAAIKINTRGRGFPFPAVRTIPTFWL